MKSRQFEQKQKHQLFERRFQLLRGGGCINNSIIHDIYQIDAKKNQQNGMPIGFMNQLIKFTNLINEKALNVKQEQQTFEIMNGILWFLYNQEQFNHMCQNDKLANQYFDLITVSLDKILKQAPTYLRISGNLGLYILSICNTFLRVLYSFFIKKKPFKLKKEYILNLEKYIEEIESILEQDQSQVWNTGFEFELLMIKIVIDQLPNDCEQGQEILNSVAFEILMSLISLQPSEGLFATIINGGKFLFNKIKNKFARPIEKYNIYFYFESLKWSVITQLKKHYSVLNIENQLLEVYNNYIENSNDWLVHYCWIKMISDILIYRPLLQRDIIFSNLNILEKRENWKKLIDMQLIKSLSYDQNIGKLVIFKNNKRDYQQFNDLDIDLYNYGINELREFQTHLITQQTQSQLKLWNSYLTYKSNSETKNMNQQQDSFEFIQLLSLFLEEQQKSKLKLNQIIQSITESLLNLKQEQNQKDNLQLIYKNDLLKKCQNIQNTILESFYLINEINFFLILSQQRIILSVNQIQQTTKKQKLVLIKSIIEDITLQYNQNFLKCLLILPQQLKEFQIVVKSFEKTLNNQSQLLNILNPFQNLTINESFLSLIGCLKILNEKMAKFQDEYDIIISTDKDLQISDIIEKDKFRNFIYEFDNFNFSFLLIEFIQNLFQLNFQEDMFTLNVTENIQENSINCQQILIYLILVQKLIQNLKVQINISNSVYKDDCNNKQDKHEIENVTEILNVIIKEQRNQLYQMIKYNHQKNESNFKQLVNLIAKNQRIIGALNFDNQIKVNILMNMTNLSAILIELSFKGVQQQQEVQNSIEQIYCNIDLEVQKLDRYYLQNLQINTLQQRNSEARQIQIDQFLQLTQSLQNLISQLNDFQSSIHHTNLVILNSSIDQNQLKEISTTTNLNIIKSIKQISMQLESLMIIRKNNKLALIDSEYLDQIDQIQYNIIFDCFNQLTNYTQNYEFQEIQKNEQDETYIYIVDIFKKLQSTSNSQKDDDSDCKVRECLCFQLLTIQNSVQESLIIQFCQQLIKQMWIVEKNQKVKQTLQSQELIDLQKKLFNQDLGQFTNDLKQEMKNKLEVLSQLEYKIRFEEDKSSKQQLQIKLTNNYQEFEEFLDKITEMSQKLDINLELIKENRKMLIQLKQKIDQLQTVIDDIAIDVKRLRGKSVNELFQIRSQVVLKQKQITEMKTIYVELKVEINDTKNGQKVETNNQKVVSWLMKTKANDFQGELNKFLQNYQDDKIIEDIDQEIDVIQNDQINQSYNQKDVMLIKGKAGAGKSTAAQKIEQFLWENQNEFKQKWIPIFIALPTIQNPKYNLLEEALESDNYNFDKTQLREFKDLINEKKINVVLILDSYDEMHFDFIQQNLYQTNRLKEQFKIYENNLGQNLKIIITTRTEILTASSYQTWFYGEKINSMIEIELMKFDIIQTQEYLTLYSILNLKTYIFSIFEYLMQLKHAQFEVQQFSSFWTELYPIIQKDTTNSNNDNLLSRSCIAEILKKFEQFEPFKYINQKQLITFENDMQNFWSASKYQKQLLNSNLYTFLETPFLIELFVHVLPYSNIDLEETQEQFSQNYIKLKTAKKVSERLIQQHKNIEGINSDLIKQQNDDFQFEVKSILEQLQSQNFFKSYSIINQIEQIDDITININNQLFTFSINEDIQTIVQAFLIKTITVYDFYNLFIEQYNEKQIQKLRHQGKIKDSECFKFDLMKYSEALALDMSIHQTTTIQNRVKGQLKLKSKWIGNNNEYWYDQYFEGDEEYCNLIRRAALLIKIGNNYSFTHKSIQEFYVAKFILGLLKKIQVDIKLEDLLQNNNQMENLSKEKVMIKCQWIFDINEGFRDLFLYQEQYMGVRSFVVEQIREIEMIENKLLFVIKLTAKFPNYIRAASNCTQLLNWFNKNFQFQDLQNIKLEYVSLYGTNFYGSNLQNSQFQNININRCISNFINSNLQNIKWQNTILYEKPIMRGHIGNINSIAFSFDGTTLASCGNDTLVNIWNYKTGKQIYKLEGHQSRVNSVCFAKDNIILASGSEDFLILLWKYKEGVLLIELDGHLSGVKQISFSNEGNTFASCSEDGTILIWDYQSKQQKSFIKAHQCCVNSIAFSIKDNIIASGSTDKSIILWEHESGNKIRSLDGHSDNITTIVFAMDGHSLVSGSWDMLIIIWDYKNGKIIRKLEGHSNAIESIALSQDGLLLASVSSDKTAILWDFKSAKQIGLLEGHSDVIFSVAFSIDGSTLASCSRDNTIILWDCQSCLQIENVDGHLKGINAIQFSLDGLILASASSDKTIIMWNTQTGQIIKKLDGHSGVVTSIAFSIDGLHIASGSYDKTIILWDIRTGIKIRSIGSHSDLITSLAFSSNGYALASGSYDKTIIIWDYKTKRIIAKLEGHSSFVFTVAFSPNGIILASGSKDKTILIWDYKQKKQIGNLQGHFSNVNCVVFSIDGIHLASCSSDCSIILWDYKSCKQVRKIGNHSNQINQIAFSQNSQTLASVSLDRTIMLWDYKAGILLQKIDGHIGNITSIAYSPDGKILASGSQDKTIRLHFFSLQKSLFQYQYSYPYSCKLEVDEAILNNNSIILNLKNEQLEPLFQSKGAKNIQK